jgi:threonine 3-dehydrogenase
MEMSGSGAAFRDMLDNMCHGGKIAMLGIPSEDLAIDWNTVIFSGLTIKGIYGREMYETWYLMQAMIQTGLDITPVITHRFHYTEFEQAFEVMRSGNSGKVIMNWDLSLDFLDQEGEIGLGKTQFGRCDPMVFDVRQNVLVMGMCGG